MEREMLPKPSATVYVFGVKRPKDSEPWYVAFENQRFADNYPHRCTAVTAVLLYDRESQDSATPNPQRGSPPFPEAEAAGGGSNSPDVSGTQTV